MNLLRRRLDFSFIVSLFCLFVFPIYFPFLHAIYFIPYLIIVFYKRDLPSALWHSFLCGCIMDFLSPHSHLGFFALVYCLTTLLLYRQRRHFFSDSVSTLPIMTYFYSALATLIEAIFFNIFEKTSVFSTKWFFTDLLIYPIEDALLGFSVFVLPYLVFGKRIRKGHEYFMPKYS